MTGLREKTAMGLALFALMGEPAQHRVVSVATAAAALEATTVIARVAEVPALVPQAVHQPEPETTLPIVTAEPSAPAALPEDIIRSRVPLRLTLLRLPEIEPYLSSNPVGPIRVPLAGTPGEATPLAMPLTGAVMPRSAAEQLAERRGLDPNDVRVRIDLRPAAVTFWIGSAARDGILRDIATQPWNADWGSDVFYGASYSHRLGRIRRDFAVDFEVGGGYRSGATNSPEAWTAVYLRYDGFRWRERLYTSFAISTGIHWMNRLPEVETGTALRPEAFQSKVLHYLSPEITFALPQHPESEVAIRYAHRSGVFGAFNGVWEGSNVLTIGYRRRL